MRLTRLEQVETALNELQRVEAAMASKTAEANRQISEIRDQALGDIGELEEQVIRLRASIEKFAETNRDDEELFAGGKKSIELHAGTIGFKLGRPSITLLNDWSTEDAVEALKGARLHTCVKTTESVDVDKSQVMKLYNAGKLDDKQLKEFGLQVRQTESFFIDLKTVDKTKAKAKAVAA